MVSVLLQCTRRNLDFFGENNGNVAAERREDLSRTDQERNVHPTGNDLLMCLKSWGQVWAPPDKRDPEGLEMGRG